MALSRVNLRASINLGGMRYGPARASEGRGACLSFFVCKAVNRYSCIGVNGSDAVQIREARSNRVGAVQLGKNGPPRELSD